MIEFMFAASPETIRSGPPELILRPVGNRRDLAACALMILMFWVFLSQKVFMLLLSR
jgi:hypothetical protein